MRKTRVPHLLKKKKKKTFSFSVGVNSFCYLLKAGEGTFACNQDGEVYPQQTQRKLSAWNWQCRWREFLFRDMGIIFAWPTRRGSSPVVKVVEMKPLRTAFWAACRRTVYSVVSERPSRRIHVSSASTISSCTWVDTKSNRWEKRWGAWRASEVGREATDYCSS